ncbi:protein E6-like [Andrographis paniculata]|uniref:protein E6-like n=1 Tax=Andrographis paniculata TaxID=175694 RepID=UPI0021E8E306|nr:protein E6-like [Andrographis paniculata]
MAFSLHLFSVIFLLPFLALAQTRNPQFFSKVPPTTTNQLPNFFPDNNNGYGLYSQEKLPQSAMATPEPSDQTILPSDFNPVAHLIKTEDLTPPQTPTRHPITQESNYYNGGGAAINRRQEGVADELYLSNGGGFRPEGMSDTRFMENGMYFYDVRNDRYSHDHPYERIGHGARNEYNNNNLDEFNGDTYEFGRQNQKQDKFETDDGTTVP